MNNSKKRITKFLEQAESKDLLSFDYLLEGFQIIGFDWKYLYLNNTAAKQGHRLKEEFLGHTMMELYPGIENTDMFSRLKICMEKRIPFQIENEFAFFDNAKSWFELRVEPVPEGILILSIDINKRKQAEERIRYLNSTLLSLRNINQLITKENNFENLIQKSCNLLVENRGFMSAWILLFDKKNKFLTAAVAGNEEMQTIFMDELKKGNYPPCVEKILNNDNSLANCETIIKEKQDCLPKRIFNNGTGLISRLEYKGKVYGVAGVYVPSIIAYDPEEKSLLKELASDFSYALYSIEEEARHKQAEEALHISEDLYRSLFENMLNGFAYCKMFFDNGKPSDFKYLIANRAFENQTGLKNVIGKKVSEIIPGIQKADPKLFEIYGRVALTGIPETFEMYVESLKMWFSVSVYSPKKEYFVAVFEVISERKRAEENLKFSNTLLLTQQETSLDGILIVDETGNIISFNQRFVNIWDVPPGVLKTLSDTKALEAILSKVKNQDQFIKKVNYLYRHKNKKSRDEIILKDGRIIDRYSSPMIGPDKENYGRVWYFRDITSYKKAGEKLEKSYKALKKNLNDVVDTMIKIVEMRDPYTAGHQLRVANLATAIATKLNLNNKCIEEIYNAAIIHDIGKIYIPSSILSKPGALTDLELQFVKAHPSGGYDIIKGIDFPASISKSILQHHERLDGSGYPQGLLEKDICLEAKILAVADVVEAISSHRPYRPALGIDKALKEIEEKKGILYDPDIVDACIKIFKEGKFDFKKTA
jgi:HD-GYP domain-containing protein (c-di-GMP phosphodiesterase class II)